MITLKYALKLIKLKKACFLYLGCGTDGIEFIAIKRFNKIQTAKLEIM